MFGETSHEGHPGSMPDEEMENALTRRMVFQIVKGGEYQSPLLCNSITS